LVWRKIYRKPLYWGKPWFTVDFPFNQSNENLIHKWYPEAITSFWTWQALGLHPPIFRRTRMLVAWCPPLIWDDHSQWTNLVQEGWFFSVKVNFKKRLNIHNIFIYIYSSCCQNVVSNYWEWRYFFWWLCLVAVVSSSA
jgi:hypothetical protein